MSLGFETALSKRLPGNLRTPSVSREMSIFQGISVTENALPQAPAVSKDAPSALVPPRRRFWDFSSCSNWSYYLYEITVKLHSLVESLIQANQEFDHETISYH
ncbi:hypothetical protein CIHG_09925 [Coccidioides immitis H538.4]|uniref:Uncharacterized protein n=2 Tax=Coccidioides immitis TaxID=5501 RepID=A0A0J8S4L3_COCIT|nr:hypothetical protein CIRG_01526 [Coccidioides immitis RMSCC 2394]KMU92087.1 hypothetical protein CIHG_09925 [Coccidioides immitis H538.4]